MRSKKRAYLVGALTLVAALTAPILGAGSSSAQEHPHPTTTTPGGPTTTPTTTPGPGPTVPQPPGNPGERTTAVRYGPYTQQPAVPNPDGSHGHWHSGNQFSLGV